MMLKLLLGLLIAARAAEAFVYSCEEVKYKIMNKNTELDTNLICVVLDDNYNNQLLDRVYAQNADISLSLLNISGTEGGCIERGGIDPWIVVSVGVQLDCDQQFTLIATSSISQIVSGEATINISSQTEIVSPSAGMSLSLRSGSGSGTISFDVGIGSGPSEQRFPLQTYNCNSRPFDITFLNTAITVSAVNCTAIFDYKPFGSIWIYSSPGQPTAWMTSGKAGDLQNMARYKKGVDLVLRSEELVHVTGEYDLTFDPRYQGNVTIYNEYNDEEYTYYNGTGTMDFISNRFEWHYNTLDMEPSEVGESIDNVVMNFKLNSMPQPSTTKQTSLQPSTSTVSTTKVVSKTTTAPSSNVNGPYCECGLDRFMMADGWDTTGIWLDVVIILDTSEAMGSNALSDAVVQIESLIGADDFDVLITDTSAPFYTRIGLIAMSDNAEVLYNLNMTKADKVGDKVHIDTGVSDINVIDAFNAALRMFNDGLVSQPKRADTRQVIYYMTDSDPKIDLKPLNQFKASQGIIVVDNFLEDGDVERPGLKDLASDGYYFSDLQSYMQTIQVFCKANCFCKPDRTAYIGEDSTKTPAGGCYHAVNGGVPFSKARQSCADNRGGIIATAHNDQKDQFLNQLMTSVAKPYFFWIGYSKFDDGTNWRWEDGSSDPFTNWGPDEPSSASVSKCAYVDQSTTELPWGAGNCQVGFPYICEYAPCSAGVNVC